MTAAETHQAIEATFRIERARLIAGLVRVVRNVDLAEELAQDALVVALAEWPRTGVPANPGAWLMAVAKRRAIDALRRDKMRARKHEEIARELVAARPTTRRSDRKRRWTMIRRLELLGLIFTACPPCVGASPRGAHPQGGRSQSRDRPLHGLRAPKRACSWWTGSPTPPRSAHYAPLPAERGDFLFLGRPPRRGASQFESAATLTRNLAERGLSPRPGGRLDCER